MPLFLACGLSPKASTAGVSPPRWMLLFVIVDLSMRREGVIIGKLHLKSEWKRSEMESADCLVLDAAKLGVEGLTSLAPPAE